MADDANFRRNHDQREELLIPLPYIITSENW
jgi:hypothetical protein